MKITTFFREVVHREMLFYKIPVHEEQEVNVTEVQVPTTFKEKVDVIVMLL